MLRHLARSVPWPLLAISAVLTGTLLRVVQEWPYQVWPLQGIAVGLLAAAAVGAFDEPAAAIVDTLPRPLAWRTAARAIAVVGLLALWLGAVWWTRTAYFGHAGAVAIQGVAAVAAATWTATWLRRRGAAAPAGVLGAAIIGGTIFVALVRPLEQHLPIFPYTAADAWGPSSWGWATAGGLGVVGLVLLLTEFPRPGHQRA